MTKLNEVRKNWEIMKLPIESLLGKTGFIQVSIGLF